MRQDRAMDTATSSFAALALKVEAIKTCVWSPFSGSIATAVYCDLRENKNDLVTFYVHVLHIHNMHGVSMYGYCSSIYIHTVNTYDYLKK